MAGTTLGVALAGRALHADNLKRFEAALGAKLAAVVGPAAALPGVLDAWAATLDVPRDADRLRTARSADTLCASLQGQDAVRQIETLAQARPETSTRAVGKSLATSAEVAGVLGDRLVKGVFDQLAARRAELEGAAELLEQAAAAVRQDELNIGLADRIRNLAEQGQRLVSGPSASSASLESSGSSGSVAPPARGKRTVLDRHVRAAGAAAARAELERLHAELEAALATAGDGVELSGHVRVVTNNNGEDPA
jgi:hypothetical protein